MKVQGILVSAVFFARRASANVVSIEDLSTGQAEQNISCVEAGAEGHVLQVVVTIHRGRGRETR